MTNRATVAAVTHAVKALGVSLDVGMVFPPKDGEEKSFGRWAGADLDLEAILGRLPRLAAANAKGAAIYLRVRESDQGHPGLIMLDDLNREQLGRMASDGFEPCLVAQTSRGNFQAWVRLWPISTFDHRDLAHECVKILVARYGADPRAVSPVQPGRLPGFTNRKPKHLRSNGLYPFVVIEHASLDGRVSDGAIALVHEASALHPTQARGARGEPRKETRGLPNFPPGRSNDRLNKLADFHSARIAGEVASGRRPSTAGSPSEVDFAVAVAAMRENIARADIEFWLAVRRSDKDSNYPARTADAAARFWTKEEMGISRLGDAHPMRFQ